MPVKDMTGLTIGRWTVISLAPRSSWPTHQAAWVCRCACGGVANVIGARLRIGRSQSCGCFKGGPGVSRTKNPAYRTVHNRLGPAREHSCVDCTRAAAEWSFRGGTGFSDDPDDYEPRCVSCHRKFDRRAAKCSR